MSRILCPSRRVLSVHTPATRWNSAGSGLGTAALIFFISLQTHHDNVSWSNERCERFPLSVLTCMKVCAFAVAIQHRRGTQTI